jgi:surface carbohydrate biosynthesis protein
MILFKKVILLTPPPHADIIVFEEANIHYVTNFILDRLPSFTYNMRPEIIYISAGVIWCFLKSLISFNWRGVKLKRLKSTFFSEILRHYRLGCFRFINPKVMITITDNSGEFHWLCKNYKEIELIAIQNGCRTNSQLDKAQKYYLKHFFCFGDYEKEFYSKFQHVVKHFYSVGSILNSYYHFNKKDSNEIKYDICAVSNMRGKESFLSKDLEDFWQTAEQMHLYLAEYVEEFGLRLAILSRSRIGEDLPDGEYLGEKEYFKKIYNTNFDFIQRDNHKLKSYQIVDESDLVIGVSSTVVREAFGCGKKVLYCDFTETKKYHDYKDIIMFTDRNYDLFKNKLNNIRHIPNDEYRSRTKDYASYLMNNEPNLPSHIQIRNKIKEYL